MPLVTCPCEKQAPMQPVRRDGVEIDVCTACRGVWLDRGELEKLLSAVAEDRADVEAERAAFQREREDMYAHPDDWRRRHTDPRGQYRGDYDDDDHKRYGYKPKKKRSIFDAFDIFD